MDNMNIDSEFLTNVISGVISKEISKKTGYAIKIKLSSLKIKMDDDSAYISVHASARTDRLTVESLVSNFVV